MFKKLTGYISRLLKSESDSSSNDTAFQPCLVRQVLSRNMDALPSSEEFEYNTPQANGNESTEAVVIIDSDDDYNNNETNTSADSMTFIDMVDGPEVNYKRVPPRPEYVSTSFENDSDVADAVIETIELSEEEEDGNAGTYLNTASVSSSVNLPLRQEENPLLGRRKEGEWPTNRQEPCTTFRSKNSSSRALPPIPEIPSQPTTTENSAVYSTLHNAVDGMLLQSRGKRSVYGELPVIKIPQKSNDSVNNIAGCKQNSKLLQRTALKTSAASTSYEPSFTNTEYSVELDGGLVMNYEKPTMKRAPPHVGVIELEETLQKKPRITQPLNEINPPTYSTQPRIISPSSPQGNFWAGPAPTELITLSDDDTEALDERPGDALTYSLPHLLNMNLEFTDGGGSFDRAEPLEHFLSAELTDECNDCMFEEVIIKSSYDSSDGNENVDCRLPQPLVLEETEINNGMGKNGARKKRGLLSEEERDLWFETRAPKKLLYDTTLSSGAGKHINLKRRDGNQKQSKKTPHSSGKSSFLVEGGCSLNLNDRAGMCYARNLTTALIEDPLQLVSQPKVNKPTSLRTQPKRRSTVDQFLPDLMAIAKRSRRPTKASKRAALETIQYEDIPLIPTEPEGPVSFAELPPKESQRSALKKIVSGASTSPRNNDLRRNSSVRFGNVTVYMFARQQGYETVPSKGGNCLGMEPVHSDIKELTLAEYASEKNRSRLELASSTGGVEAQESRLMLSDETDADEDDEQYSDEQEGEQDYGNEKAKVLRPKERRQLLHASGVTKVVRASDLDFIRSSRAQSGCKCIAFCHPDSCFCSQNGIECQEEGSVCPCSSATCRNTTGHIVFSKARINEHFEETMARLCSSKNQITKGYCNESRSEEGSCIQRTNDLLSSSDQPSVPTHQDSRLNADLGLDPMPDSTLQCTELTDAADHSLKCSYNPAEDVASESEVGLNSYQEEVHYICNSENSSMTTVTPGDLLSNLPKTPENYHINNAEMEQFQDSEFSKTNDDSNLVLNGDGKTHDSGIDVSILGCTLFSTEQQSGKKGEFVENNQNSQNSNCNSNYSNGDVNASSAGECNDQSCVDKFQDPVAPIDLLIGEKKK